MPRDILTIMKFVTKLKVSFYAIAACLICWAVLGAAANALQSTHFQFNETSLGGIGTAKTESASYQALTSGGIIGFGNSADATMQVNNGHETTNDPALSFAVASPIIYIGNFSAGTTATTTSTFAVSDYTSYGYVVQVLGNPPTNGTHTITAMASTAPSQAGVEQFGINLVANTSPTSLGNNPDHGQFGFGSATSDYGTTNSYRYVSGETVASAPKSSGITIYTISYIVNVSSFTPGGDYTGDQTMVCTATF